MKKVILTLIAFTFFSCQQKADNSLHLYSQIEICRKELEKDVDAENEIIKYAFEESRELKERFKKHIRSVNLIANSSRHIGNADRDKILNTRDSLNKSLGINLNLAPRLSYKKIDDSIFKKTIEIDFLRLRKHYQEKYILPFLPKEIGL
ncbi:MAG: hypothetical protein EOO99_12055 [Pedobacter sp.]|nr:MAG: hypothetical protein EOO99_12055 [Pedobacter sp.]